VKRELGAFERALTLTDDYSPFNVVATVRLAGSPSPDALRQALDILQKRHPLLMVRIVRDRRQRFFESEGTPAIPLQLVQRTDDEHWLRLAEEELNNRVDTAVGPLLRCSYLSSRADQANSEIMLTFPHVAVDGPSGVNLCHELLSLCVAVSEGETHVGDDPLPLLAASEEFFPSAFQGWSRTRRTILFFLRQMADELSYRLRSRGTGKASPNPTARSRVLPMRISRAATAALVRHTRSRRVTLASVLNAATLLAASKHLYDGQDLPLRYFVFPNLRPYLKPPVPVENLAPLLTMMRFTIRVRPDHDLWSLASEINAQTHAAFKRGDKFIFPLLAAPMMRALIKMKSRRMGTTAVSYTGAPGINSTYGSHRVTGIHVFVSNIDLGPEYTAQARLFDGELLWDIVYMDSDMDLSQATVIAEAIRGILQSPNSREAEQQEESAEAS
jgi:hypothetical protein